MRVVVVTPAEPVIEVEEAREHLRVDHGDDDQLIAVYIAAATGHLAGPDGWLGRSLGEQVLEAYPPSAGPVTLPYRPVIAIEAVETRAGSIWTAVDPTSYELVGDQLVLSPGASWAGAATRVRYRAGYEDLPAAIRVAILMMVSDMYRFRGTAVATGAAVEVSASVQMLLQPFRVYSL